MRNKYFRNAAYNFARGCRNRTLELATIGAKKWCPLQYTVDIALYCGFLLSFKWPTLKYIPQKLPEHASRWQCNVPRVSVFRSDAGLIEEKKS